MDAVVSYTDYFIALCLNLKKVYNWKPVLNIEKAVSLSVDWYKAYYKGCDMKDFTKNQILSFFK